MKRVGVGQLIVIWDLEQVNHKMNSTATIHYSKILPQCHAVAFNFFHFHLFNLSFHTVEFDKINYYIKNFGTNN